MFLDSFLDGKCLFRYFGSRRLNAKTEFSDIDILCILSNKYYNRTNIYELFHIYLRDIIHATNIVIIPSSFVPVVKFDYQGDSYDVIFSFIQLDIIPHINDANAYGVYQELLFYSCSEEDTRSLCGAMVSEYISKVCSGFIGVYSHFLIQIKKWVYRRGLYSNILGYFNGVSLAVLVAHYFLYTKKMSTPNFHEFIRIYLQWNEPITLIPTSTSTSSSTSSYTSGFLQIYTPTNPPINTMYNTSYYQLQTIQKEFRKTLEGGFIGDIYPYWFRSKKSVYTLIQVISFTKELHQKNRLYIESKLKHIPRMFQQTDLEFDFCTHCYTLEHQRTFFIIRTNRLIDIHPFFIKLQNNLLHEAVINIDHVQSEKLPSFIFI